MTKKKKEYEHNPCSPSQLKNRYLCPGSVRLIEEAEFPDRETVSSEAAQRGTFLHDCCENIVQGIMGYSDIKFTEKGDENAVVWSVSKVHQILDEYENPTILLEQQIDLDLLGIPSGEKGNRVDVLIVIPGEGVVVIDYKFGTMWTDHPKFNRQFRAYGWGAWNKYGGKWVRCIKLQPELEEDDRYMEHTYQADEMETIGSDIKTIVDRTRDPNAPLVRGDTQCKFCNVMDVCPQHKGMVLQMPMHLSMASHWLMLSPMERKVLYENVQALLKWVNHAIKVIAASTIEGKLPIEGYEVRKGQKKQWSDDQKALMALRELAEKAEKDPDLLVKPQELISVSAAHKIFGNAKNVKDYIGELWELVDGPEGLKKIKEKKEKLV